jgi:hypothetical protein
MKGYAFLDADGRMQYRSQEYIDVDNPFFWQQNRYDILRKWKFDTEDMASMLFMFRHLRDLRLSADLVMEFCTMINFDVETLKNANKV